jgi:hypothetical protein
VGKVSSLVGLYAFVAAILAGRLLRRYSVEDGWIATLVMIAFASIACGAGGMLVGEQLSVAAENISVGPGRLSYRLDRLPWRSHEFSFSVLCVALFWCAAAVKAASTARPMPDCIGTARQHGSSVMPFQRCRSARLDRCVGIALKN